MALNREQEQTLGRLNLIGQLSSVLTIPLILVLAYWVRLEIHSAVSDFRSEAAATYALKSELKEDVVQLSAADTRTWVELSNFREEERRQDNSASMALQRLKDVLYNQKIIRPVITDSPDHSSNE